MAALYKLHYPDLFIPGVTDPKYNLIFVYSTVECNLAIIMATIPPLHGLMRRWFPRVFHISLAKNSAYSGGSRGVLQTIGGAGGVACKDLKSPVRSQHTRLNSLTNSEEEILGKDRITRTTSVHISYQNGEKDKNHQPPSYAANYDTDR